MLHDSRLLNKNTEKKVPVTGHSGSLSLLLFSLVTAPRLFFFADILKQQHGFVLKTFFFSHQDLHLLLFFDGHPYFGFVVWAELGMPEDSGKKKNHRVQCNKTSNSNLRVYYIYAYTQTHT